MPATPPKFVPYYTLEEEIANSITHGLGTALSLAGLIVLLVYAVGNENAWQIVSFAIFGGALVILYLASTLYHSLPQPMAKKVFQIFDHAAIYLLIAGSYTPFMLVRMRGVWGWSVLIIIWACALCGIILKALCITRFQKFTLALYVVMGWLCVFVLKELIHELPRVSLILLILGGLSYTVGLIFYARNARYSHTIWHLFVLGGSIFHYFSVLMMA
jgi:hemolysin III